MNQITVSTITPVYNGAKYLKKLVTELETVKKHWTALYPNLILMESIFVIDDAIDNSLEVLNELKKERDWISTIVLSRNFGQHPATVAGILYSSGDWIFTLDEDCQHHPKYFESFLKAIIEKNDDVCYGNSEIETHKSFVRDRASKFYKNLLSRVLYNPSVTVFNSYRLIRGDIARATAAIARHEAYFDIVLTWFTKRITTTPVQMIDERNQISEQSGYSFLGLIKHGIRMLMTSRIKFLRLGIFIGFLSFCISILFLIGTFYAYFYDLEMVKGWSSTFTAILFFGGTISLILGFVLETSAQLLNNSNGKPTFFTIDRSSDARLKKIFKS